MSKEKNAIQEAVWQAYQGDTDLDAMKRAAFEKEARYMFKFLTSKDL